ncbi:MAG: DUF4928 family protein [Acidobacteria bacterium]|nr:DUF4928 family protein [Acidobacteriota bacterium]
MGKQQTAIELFRKWYEALQVYSTSGGPARGTIGAALVVLERLTTEYDLRLSAHRAAGQSQIRGVSQSAVAQILLEFGETRPFLKEGGRTNRGGPGDIEKMLSSLQQAGLESLALEKRNSILKSLQQFLVEKVREFHNRQRLKLVYDPSKSTWHSIRDLLALARDTGKEGPVAQYLVGAKLCLRFPKLEIGNESYSTADDQLGRPGDFYLGDTVFHVTVAPMTAVYEKCLRNVENGFRVYLLVPDRILVGARQNADATAIGRIAVESIESFVGNNVEELSTFSKAQLAIEFLRLLKIYNRRVDDIENDKSMMIEIPPNLLRFDPHEKGA